MSIIPVLLRVPGLRLLAALLTSARLRVEGDSMAPSFLPGQYVLVDRTAYHLRPPRRGDAVTVQHPSLDEKTLLKRIVALPGERVNLSQGKVLINGQPLDGPCQGEEGSPEDTLGPEWRLGDDEYFVLGDNPSDSLDSRRLGPVKSRWIVGKVRLRLWHIGS